MQFQIWLYKIQKIVRKGIDFMAIYVIADLHLSFQDKNKNMSFFGGNWIDYEEKIKENWIKTVKDEDLVILPGDFSWAMQLEETIEDFAFIESLPGKKLLLKGNHDYWWSTVTKINKFLKENNFNSISVLYNDSFCYNDYIIVGTRGWNINADEQQDKKINSRELLRLEASIKDGLNKFGNDKKIVCCMHFPPITKVQIIKNESSKYLNLLKNYNITECYYGHLHSTAHKEAIEGDVNGINLKLISSDYLNFELFKIN